MNRHLTGDELLDAVSSGLDPESREHVEACDSCRGRFLELTGALDVFGKAVRGWSEREMHSSSARPERRGIAPLLVAFSSAVVVAALIWIGTGFFAGPNPAKAVASDSTLLQQVQVDVTRQVPLHLEPLLVPSNGGADRTIAQ